MDVHRYHSLKDKRRRFGDGTGAGENEFGCWELEVFMEHLLGSIKCSRIYPGLETSLNDI